MSHINAREIFIDSILELIKTKSFDEITVSSIVEYSGVSRQSFYNYFRDKYDLVNQIYDHDLKMAINDLQSYGIYTDSRIEASIEGMSGKRTFYNKVLKYSGQNALMYHIKEVAYSAHKEIVLSHISAMPKYNKLPVQKIPYLLNFHANCATLAVIDWVTSDTYMPPREVAALIIDSIPRMLKPCYTFSRAIECGMCPEKDIYPNPWIF